MIKSFYRLFYTLLIVFILGFCYSDWISMGEISTAKIYLIIIIATLLCFIGLIPAKIRVMIIIAAFLGMLWLVFEDGFNFSFFHNYINIIIFGDSSDQNLSLIYSYIHIVFVTAAAFFLVLFFSKINIIKYILSIPVLILPVYMMINKISVSKNGFIVSIIFVLAVGIEYIQAHWKKRISCEKESYLVWLIPFVFIYVMALMLVKYPSKPYDWKYTRNLVHNISEQFSIIKSSITNDNREDFDTNMTGFYDSSSFFGGVEDNPQPVMTIEGDKKLVTNMYMSGRSYDSFYGRGWERKK